MSPYILYVDDELSNLVVFEAAFKGQLPVMTASSGSQALELMREHEVAVLLTDQRMPGMSGVELIARARSEHPDTVRMMMTAYSDLDAAVEAINLGQVHLYLRKPWEPVELKALLTQARDRYLAQRRVLELEQRLVSTERVYALGVIAAGVAHEIRTPLTTLSMNLELVGMLLSEHLDPDQLHQARRSLADIGLAAEAILEITNALELSTRSRNDAEVDLKEVFELAARSVRSEARQRGTVRLELATVPLVKGTRVRLGQVAVNLLLNALQAFDPARQEQNLVVVRLTHDGQRVKFSVDDNGPGMAAEVQHRIFDPFFTTKSEGGTGLGLAISRQIILELGGSIDVTSVVGQGTSFVVRLPVA
jgi:two-component system NtrC family sensor kinase